MRVKYGDRVRVTSLNKTSYQIQDRQDFSVSTSIKKDLTNSITIENIIYMDL